MAEMTAVDTHLDNAVWHALRGPNRRFREHLGRAVRFQPDVAPFAAIDDPDDAQAWRDLATLANGKPTVLFRHRVDPPPGWTEVVRYPGHQLLGDGVNGQVAQGVEELGTRQVPEMTALVQLTQPGPFHPRTIRLGRYVGVVRDGALVAMAGQRLNQHDRHEISAVCTHPAHRGQGLAAALVRHLVATSAAQGAGTYLHVAADNAAALRLYRSLGFAVRRSIDAVVLQPPAGR